jgi:F420 biosynthesis protein FbiB-like protein
MLTDVQSTATRTPELLDAIRSRRSIRRYQPREVPPEILTQVMAAACWAPSAHNRQPWRFAILSQPETKIALATAMGEKLRADLERDGMAPELIERDAGRSHQRLTTAPAIVVACLTLRDMDHYPDPRRSRAEYLMAAQSCAMAVQNMLLAAHGLGLGACWMCAPLFVPETVRDVLRLEPDWEPQALITLGYPAEERTKTRAPLSAVCRYVDSNQSGPQSR